MARLLSLLFEVTELFDMQTRPELLLVQKTMVVVEAWRTSASSTCSRVGAGGEGLGQRHLGPAGQLEQAADGIGARAAGQQAAAARRAGRAAVGEFGRMNKRASASPRRSRDRALQAHATRAPGGALEIAAVALIFGLRAVF
jgi:ubiquinone biosynthesis protein